MNRERALLQRLVDSGVLGGYSFIAEVKGLLAQPEQEPVAWCQMVEGKVQDLLTSFEMKDWLYDKSWMPLYTSPPKREQIKRSVLTEAEISKTLNYAYDEDGNRRSDMWITTFGEEVVYIFRMTDDSLLKEFECSHDSELAQEMLIRLFKMKVLSGEQNGE